MTDPRFTCGGCDNRWSGFNRCHCSACHRTFGGVGLFDAHHRERRGKGECIPPEQITTTNKAGAVSRVMFLTDAGIWQGTEHPSQNRPPKRGTR